MGSSETLGSDENSAGKAVHFTVVLIVLMAFVFSLANLTDPAKSLANFYLLFAIPPLVAIIYDIVARQTRGKPELPDTVTVEKESPVFGEMPRWAKALIVSGSLAFGGWILLSFSGKSALALVTAPSFQLINPGPAGSAFLSGVAGIIENLAFFGFIGPTAYVVFSRLIGERTGRKAAAIALSILLAASVFTAFHIGVYGESAEKLDQVFYFGLICGGSTTLTGNIVPCHSLHFFNNFGITFFRQTSADVFLWVVLYWLLIASVTVAYLRRPS